MGSARFARSAAAALGGLMGFSDGFFVFANAKNKKCDDNVLDVDRVHRQTDSQTSILGSRAAYLTYVSHQDFFEDLEKADSFEAHRRRQAAPRCRGNAQRWHQSQQWQQNASSVSRSRGQPVCDSS